MSATPLREAALAEIAARLAAQLPDVAVHRARRARVDTDTEVTPAAPVLVLRGGDLSPDTEFEFGVTRYAIGLVVHGYVRAATDLAAEQALSLLHARVVGALVGWESAIASLGEVIEGATQFDLYDAEDSAAPAGEFTAAFTIRAAAPTGGAYAT